MPLCFSLLSVIYNISSCMNSLTYSPVSWSSRIHRLHLCWGVRHHPGPVSWGCTIHWLHFCRRLKKKPNECPVYDTKQFDGEAPVMLELWGMQSVSLLPLPPGPLWRRVVAPDRVLSMGQIEQNCVLMLNCIAWNRVAFVCKTELFETELFRHLTVCKQNIYLY